MIFSGDGVRLVVLQSEGDGGSISGELRRGKTAVPFRARFEEAGGDEVLVGTYVENGQTKQLRGKQSLDTGALELTIDGKTYRLEPTDVDTPDAAGPPQHEEKPVAPSKAKEPAKTDDARALPDQLKLKAVSIPDITMGNVQAATILVPEGWKFQGHIEWRGTPLPYAQRSMLLTSDDGYSMEFPFDMVNQYTNNGMQEQGMPAPQDGPQWIASMISQRQGATNVRTIKADRDERYEQVLRQRAAQMGNESALEYQCWVVRSSYEENGTQMTEEVAFTLMISPQREAAGLVAQTWYCVFDVAWRAPSSKFEAMRPVFQMIHRSYRDDPRWFARQAEIRTQMIRQQTQDMIAAIKAQAEKYNQQVSETDMNAWKQKNAADDEAQRLRINSIAESHDYRDIDGTRVNVPIHYKSVFGDGQGNYVLTNNSYQPGGDFRELNQWK